MINEIKKIEGWKTSDGELFDVEEQAIRHQYKIEIIERIKKFVEDHISSNMDRWDIERILIDSVEELFGPELDILQKSNKGESNELHKNWSR